MAAALARQPFLVTGSRGCFYYICRKQKKEVDPPDLDVSGLLSLRPVWHNGWAELDDWCQLLVTRLLSRGSSQLPQPKVARVVFTHPHRTHMHARTPHRRPSTSQQGAPASRKDPLLGLEWLLLGPLVQEQGREDG